MTLRDAVRTASNSVSKASRDLAALSADDTVPIPQRVAAFRELTARDVGRYLAATLPGA